MNTKSPDLEFTDRIGGGLDELKMDLRNMEKPAEPLLRDIGREMERLTKLRLGEDKYDFAPLKKSTLKARRKGKKTENTKAVPLVDTGTMMKQITWSLERMGYELRIGVQTGDGVRYAKFHQKGTKNMKQRKFLVFLPEDVDTIGKMVDEYYFGDF
ncbi:MAG: phage virion morphogenesis protein [Spirochaetales bacterium]|jgi:phage gpG-like protein|nr:phage virion morphogenesis protein [Spirochaetales bacterium]